MTLAQRIQQAVAMTFGGGLPLSNRNGFIDPSFRQWYFTASNPATLTTGIGYPGPVMWRIAAGTGGAGTVSWVDNRFTADAAYMEATDDVSASYKLNITTGATGTIAAGTAGLFCQYIEGAAKYAGKSITMSFKLKVDAGSMTIPQTISRQNFGTGGSPSALVTFDKVVNWVVGTTYKKFSVRIDVPNVIGKLIGTANNDMIQFGFWLPPGVTGNLSIAEPQLELCSPFSSSDTTGAGGSPTSFEYRGAAQEDRRTARYYRAIQTSGASFLGGATGTSDAWCFGQTLNPTMRSAPAIGLAGTWTFTAPAGNSGTVSGVAATPDNWYLHAASGTYTAGQTGYFGSSAGGAVVLDSRL